MGSIRNGRLWVLVAVLVGCLTWVLQSGPGPLGVPGGEEQVEEAQVPGPDETEPVETPDTATQPSPAPGTGKLELEVTALETRTLTVLASEGSPVERETVFAELKRRHTEHALDLAHLLPLAALRGDPDRRDDVRAIGDWARRQIEAHAERDILVEPILTLWFEYEEGPRGALLDLLDDLGRMKPRNVKAARRAFMDQRASYRLRRSILLLLPSVAERAVPMVLPLVYFRDEVVSGNPMTLGLLPPVFRIRVDPVKPPVLVRPKPAPRPPTPPGGFQREHLEVQIDALFEQIGAPALREMVRAYRVFLAGPQRGSSPESGWTIYDEPIIASAHLDVDLILAMARATSHPERRLAAQALRDLETKSPDVERALERLRNDPDRLVREFASRR
jgi:hypothetical protein